MTVLNLATVGGKVTAALINQLVNVLTVRTAYTPTVTNWDSATVLPTTTGYYWITGNICHVIVTSKLGTGAITVGNITVSLPVPMVTTGMILETSRPFGGVGSLMDVSGGSTGDNQAIVRVIDANTVRVMRSSAANPGVAAAITSTLPFTWQTLDEFSISFSYPVG